jgi:protein phosphatase
VFDPESEHMIVGHVGDSRAYRVRAGEITRMTRDHSLSGEAVPSERAVWFESLAKNALTRALGLGPSAVVDLRKEPVNVSDLFVLCSDGLTSLVADHEILEVISAASDLQQACATLVERANRAGGDDNITVVVMRVI